MARRWPKLTNFQNGVKGFLGAAFFNKLDKAIYDIDAEVESLGARLGTVVASNATVDNAETIDARVGADGTIHPCAGDNVRSIATGEGLLDGSIKATKLNNEFIPIVTSSVLDNFSSILAFEIGENYDLEANTLDGIEHLSVSTSDNGELIIEY